MRALTIRQPHAGAVALGLKTVENRPGAFSYRGPVLIHAGQHLGSPIAFQEVEELTGAPVPMLGAPGAPTATALGAVIAVAELVDSHRWVDCGRRCTPWSHVNKGHNFLRGARVLRYPVPAAGNTILWAPSEDLVAEVMEALR